MELNADNQPQAEDVARPENSEVEPVEQDTQSTPEAAEGQPEAEKVPLRELLKQRKKTQAERSRVEELEQQLKARDQELELFKIVGQPQQNEPVENEDLLPPDRFDFDNHDQWVQAQREYNKKYTAQLLSEAEKVGRDKYLKEQEAEQQRLLQEKQKEEQRERLNAFADKADELGVPQEEFQASHEVLYDGVWKPWFYHDVVDFVDNPHQLILELGKDPKKALELAQTYDQNGIAGMKAILEYANSINPINQKGDPLPEPDEPLKGGAGGVSLNSYESELEKSFEMMRERKRTMNEHLAFKKQLKEKYGVT